MGLFLVTLLSIGCLFYQPENNTVFENLEQQISSIVNGINDVIIKDQEYKFKSEKVEFIKEINNVKTDETMYYVDLEGENGYFVIDKEGTICLFDTQGDYPQIKSSYEVVCYENNIFCDGEIIDIQQRNNQNIIQYGNVGSESSNYIEYDELDGYITNRYQGYDFSMTLSNKLDAVNSNGGLGQLENSVFTKVNSTGNRVSEPNCVIVSLANVFKYYYWYKGLTELPNAGFVRVEASEDILYPYIEAAGYTLTSEYVFINNSVQLARNKAFECGYRLTALSELQAKYIYEESLMDCGYDANHNLLTSFTLSDITTEINSDRPLQLFVVDDETYNTHAMMITGYSVYGANVNIGMFNAYLELVFVSVFDGRSSTERWYDLTILNNLGDSYSRANLQYIAKLTVS